MKNKYNILIWVISILVILNLTIVGTILIKSTNCTLNTISKQSEKLGKPKVQLGKFFKDELNLSYEQHNTFREIRHKYHNDTDKIKENMQSIRNQLFIELGNQNSNKEQLDYFANEIGNLHKELKLKTIQYYLDMKIICNVEQKDKLFKLFKEISDQNGNIMMPKKENNY